MLAFGSYPTPVACLEPLSTAKTTLWVKRDDLSDPVYGGSKPRKLARLLADATSRGFSRVVTVGAVGSHHVLATGVFGKRMGLSVAAVVLRQPQSRHVLETARASLGQGVELVPAASYGEAARYLAQSRANGLYAIPAGGSSPLGTLGVVAAVLELAEQVRAGLLPEPDLIVLPLGSGGTAAGLSLGLVRAGLRTRVLAIAIAEPVEVLTCKAQALVEELAEPAERAAARARFTVERRYLGQGYGFPTSASEHATSEAQRCGLSLDHTYTGKAFAAALDRVQLGSERHVLFWHTLSSADLAPLLLDAPREHELPSALRRLAYG